MSSTKSTSAALSEFSVGYDCTGKGCGGGLSSLTEKRLNSTRKTQCSSYHDRCIYYSIIIMIITFRRTNLCWQDILRINFYGEQNFRDSTIILTGHLYNQPTVTVILDWSTIHHRCFDTPGNNRSPWTLKN